MASGELVSIVIPTHNRVELLAPTLLSAQRQSYDRIEIIVVDDGSTDGTPEVVTRFAALDGRIRHVRLAKRMGVASARGAGWEASRGDFIQFLDSDDLLHPEKTRVQVERLLQEPSLDFVACQTVHFHTEPGDSPTLWHTFAGENPLLRFARDEMVWQTAAPLIRRSAIERFGQFDSQMARSDDWEFYYRFLAHGCKYELQPHAMVFYRRHVEQLSWIGYSLRAPSKVYGHKKAARILEDEGRLTPPLRQEIAISLIKASEALWMGNDLSGAMEAIRLAAEIGGSSIQPALERLQRSLPPFDERAANPFDEAKASGLDWSTRPEWWSRHKVAGEGLQPVPVLRRFGRERRSVETR